MAGASQSTQHVVDVSELGQLVRARRAARGLSLRDLQEELANALSASALSRIENGAIPEPRNVAPIAEWLGIRVGNIAWPGQDTPARKGQTTPDVVEVHLRADKKLDPVAADVLARTFRLLYNDIVAGRIPLTGRGSER